MELTWVGQGKPRRRRRLLVPDRDGRLGRTGEALAPARGTTSPGRRPVQRSQEPFLGLDREARRGVADDAPLDRVQGAARARQGPRGRVVLLSYFFSRARRVLSLFVLVIGFLSEASTPRRMLLLLFFDVVLFFSYDDFRRGSGARPAG